MDCLYPQANPIPWWPHRGSQAEPNPRSLRLAFVGIALLEEGNRHEGPFEAKMTAVSR